MNTPDPGTCVVRTQSKAPVLDYNAQFRVNDQQVVLTAEITTYSRISATSHRWRRSPPRTFDEHDPRLTAVLLTDPGCWHQRQMEHVVSDGMQVLVPPDGGRRPDIRSGWTGGFYDFMRRALSTDAGRDRHRQIAIEPVFDRI